MSKSNNMKQEQNVLHVLIKCTSLKEHVDLDGASLEEILIVIHGFCKKLWNMLKKMNRKKIFRLISENLFIQIEAIRMFIYSNRCYTNVHVLQFYSVVVCTL